MVELERGGCWNVVVDHSQGGQQLHVFPEHPNGDGGEKKDGKGENCHKARGEGGGRGFCVGRRGGV